MAQAALKKSESTSDKSSRAFPRALSDRRTRLIAAPFIGLILALPWLHQALWPLEWLGLAAALWVVAESDSPIEATLTTFLIGFSGILMAFYWLVATINLFGNYSEVPSALLFGVLAIYMGLQWAAFGGIAKWLGPGPMLLTAPIVWVAIEFLFPTVFPYRMGAINADVIALAQIADITGVFALSFLMVWMGAAAVAAIRECYFQALYAPIAATLFILVYGVVRLLTFSADQPSISVALLQGNISVGQKFDRANFQKNIQQYRSKSLSLGDRADLIVWPETVVQFALDGRLKQLPAWADPVLSVSHPVLFGTHVWDPDSNGQPRFYDSALLVGPDATVWGRYDKQVLMPFGEYMPLENVFPFLRKFDPNKTVYAESRPERSMATPLGIKIAPLICYDDLFPSIAREGVRQGGQLLVAMNNDGWYGDTAALTQHDVLARWRAIESRRYFAKSDNVGITNVIDPLGRDVARLKPFVEDALVAKIRPMSTITFYTRFGDLFAELVVLSLVILVGRQVSARSRPPVRKKK